MRTGVANLPLHYGTAPRWLFARMAKLSREIVRVMVEEWGPPEVLRRLSDPFWFQSFGCVLGYDWHSSGLTTVVCGALKEGLRGLEKDLGIFVCGGKGGTSRKTPLEIERFSENFQLPITNFQNLVYASKMSAKVDNTALQDGYQLYHHNFFFTSNGQWAVVQQGMNPLNRMARRYHWYSQDFSDFVKEPQSAICCAAKGEVLDLTAKKSQKTRDLSAELVSNGINTLVKDISRLEILTMPERHGIYKTDFNVKRLEKTLRLANERQPQNFEQLLGIKGVGPKTIRALSLISDLIYGAKPSYKDPARFAFALGGKDGVPYPVDRQTYDRSIEILSHSLHKTKLPHAEKQLAFKRLFNW